MDDLINRQAEIKAPDDRISYAIICDKFPIPQTRYATYDLAVKWAKLDQPNHRPFYIVKCTEHFEICKEVKDGKTEEQPSAQPEQEPVEWIEHHEPNTWMGYTY